MTYVGPEAAVQEPNTDTAVGEPTAGQSNAAQAPKRQRRTYSTEEKKAIVKAALDRGNATAVAKEHGLQPNLLYRWMDPTKGLLPTEGEATQSVSNAAPTGEPETVEEIKAEINRLKMKLGMKLADEALKQ